jgi:hypothetical protein
MNYSFVSERRRRAGLCACMGLAVPGFEEVHPNCEERGDLTW